MRRSEIREREGEEGRQFSDSEFNEFVQKLNIPWYFQISANSINIWRNMEKHIFTYRIFLVQNSALFRLVRSSMQLTHRRVGCPACCSPLPNSPLPTGVDRAILVTQGGGGGWLEISANLERLVLGCIRIRIRNQNFQVNTILVVNTCKYSLESSWRDLQDLHAFALLIPLNISSAIHRVFVWIFLDILQNFAFLRSSKCSFCGLLDVHFCKNLHNNYVIFFRNFGIEGWFELVCPDWRLPPPAVMGRRAQ